jgi:hypothetical protein
MRYLIDIGYPSEAGIDDQDLFQIAGDCSESSGTGFGVRDHQFLVRGRRQAKWLRDALAEHIGAGPQGTVLTKNDEPYANYGWEPKSFLLLLAYNRDWIELRREIGRRLLRRTV